MRTRRRLPWLPALTLLLGLLLPSASAEATVALHMSDAQQAARSDVVVLCTVRAQGVVAGEDGRPYTHTTLEVERSLKGAKKKGEQIVVRQMGGTLGGSTLQIPGDAHFEIGERVVVFLADREPAGGRLFLTALAQSKLSVIGRSPTGDLLLRRELDGLLLLDAAHAPTQPAPTLTLQALLQAIKQEVRR